MTLRPVSADHRILDDTYSSGVVVLIQSGDMPPDPDPDPDPDPGPPPEGFVQGLSHIDADSGDTTVLAFPSDISPDGFLVVAVGWDDDGSNANNPDVNDDQNNGFQVAQGPDYNGGLGYTSQVFFGYVWNPGTDSITVTWPAATTNRRVMIHEYAGQFNSVDQSTVSTDTTLTPNASLTLINQDELLFAWCVSGSGIMSVQDPFTIRETTGGDSTADFIMADPGTFIVSFTAATSADSTLQFVSFFLAV